MNVERPHDTFFKQLMNAPNVLKDFIKSLLPKEVLSCLDLNSLQIIDTEKSNRKYKKYYLDISAQCKFCNQPGEIYLVFEHKSYPDKLTLIQILNYLTVVFEEDLKNGQNPRPVLPIVFYHGKKKFSLPTRFGDYFQVDERLKKYLLDFEIFLFDTGRYSNEELLRFSQNMYLAASLLLFKNIFKDIRELKPILKQVLKIEIDNVEYLLNYIVMAKDIEEEKFGQILREIGGKDMPSLAKRWLEQGKQEGWKMGLKQGKEEGWKMGLKQGLIAAAQEVALDLLETRFSNVPKHIQEKIKRINDRKLLKQVHKLILKVQNMEDFEQRVKKLVK